MPPNHLILCRPLLLLPSIFPSIRVFPNESVLRMRWPKHWSFTFSISPSKGYSGLISFRMDWLDLLAVQGTLKTLQHHSSKASILRRSAFFIVQLSHPYVTSSLKAMPYSESRDNTRGGKSGFWSNGDQVTWYSFTLKLPDWQTEIFLSLHHTSTPHLPIFIIPSSFHRCWFSIKILYCKFHLSICLWGTQPSMTFSCL